MDILEHGAGFVLSVGPVSLWLGPNTALDVLEALARAVAAEEAQKLQRDTRTPRATSRRRIFS